MPAAVAEPRHRARPTIFATEAEYSLAADALVRERGGATERLAYADVAEVRLENVPSNVGVLRRCLLRSRGGERWVVPSAYYRGLGRVEDHSATYEPLVRGLVERVGAASPGAVFLHGHSRAMWLVWLGVLVLAVAAIAGGLLVFAQAGSLGSGVGAFAVVVGLLPLVWRAVRKGAPAPFRPGDDIP